MNAELRRELWFEKAETTANHCIGYVGEPALYFYCATNKIHFERLLKQKN
jgi:hypothetical protein